MMLTLHLADTQAVYRHYLPFIQDGAIFIASTQKVQLGDEQLIMLSYQDLTAPVAGKVVWINPSNHAQQEQGFAICLNRGMGKQFKLAFDKALLGIATQQPRFAL
ncbi:MAG: hypothetical protein Q4D05_00890 [Acinetobacter sp.]|nr:hypothetical protein [Acinetobacter sp.]